LGLLEGLCFNAALRGFLEVPGATLALFGNVGFKCSLFNTDGSLARRFNVGLGGKVEHPSVPFTSTFTGLPATGELLLRSLPTDGRFSND
jgi:hypothetical protein